MRTRNSRPIPGSGSYARSGSVNASAAVVVVERSESGARVLVSSVVTMKILEGK
jgi:hypothetical protein